MKKETLQVRRWVAVSILAVALVSGGVLGSLAIAQSSAAAGGAQMVPVMVAGAQTPGGEGYAAVVKKALPAVVNISSSRTVQTSQGRPDSPMFADPFFQQFFGQGFGQQFQVPPERRERSRGSGVIVSPDGYLLTNDHVIDKATEIKIFLSDKRELTARVVGTDPKTDIAVLKVDAKDLPVLPLGDSSAVQVGDLALAIGNPFGVGQTVTMGIISAMGRGGLGIEDYEDFIQTDAAINPGNSGGALINTRGELVGINTAIVSGAGGNQGVGFAVPINMARHVMEQILKDGKVVRGWLGVVIQPMDSAKAKAFGLSEAYGALVGDVSADSPAAVGGLMRGDVVLEMDGQRIEDNRALQLKVGMTPPDTVVKLTVFRDGQERNLSVKLGVMPGTEEETAGGSSQGRNALEGVAADALSPQVARQLGLPAGTNGIVVTNVAPGSAAAEAGLRRGDVIQEVNRTPVMSVAEFEALVNKTAGNPVLLLVNRGGSTSFVVIEPLG